MTTPTNDENPVDLDAAGYRESDEHVPDPTHAFGTLDTSGTAGGANERIEAVSPIFDAARANDLATAAKAVDPDDDSVRESGTVVLPDNALTPDAARDNIRAAADAASDNAKVQDPSVTAAQNQQDTNKGKSDAEVKADAEAQQRSASSVGGTGTGGTESTGKTAGAPNTGTTDTTKK